MPDTGGLIFDLDDTLALTTPIWSRAGVAGLQPLGREWTAELTNRCKGMNIRDVAATVQRLLRLDAPLPELQERMRSALLAAYATLPIEPVPGAIALVRRLQGLAPIAVASGSPPEGIRRAVEDLGLKDAVQVCLSSEPLPRGKPHPDVFRAAAQALSTSGESCVVFEDSLAGVQAARAAGMFCIVRPSYPSSAFAKAADRVVSTWDEVTREQVEAVLAARRG